MRERANTCAFFVAQANRGIKKLEADVRRTADGHWVCIHDENTQSVAQDAMNVSQTSFETLRSLHLLDVDGQTRRADLIIPTLEEFLSICRKYEAEAVIHTCPGFDLQEAIASSGYPAAVFHDL